jgi:hypothetical protein
MAELSIAQQLQYAKLQMAAEAFLVNQDGGFVPSLSAALVEGNKHTSKFATQQEATDFLDKWQVVAQKPNTSSGFSGTLFKYKDTGEYVISSRSTEFIDDAVNDCQTTNKSIVPWGPGSNCFTPARRSAPRGPVQAGMPEKPG